MSILPEITVDTEAQLDAINTGIQEQIWILSGRDWRGSALLLQNLAEKIAVAAEGDWNTVRRDEKLAAGEPTEEAI